MRKLALALLSLLYSCAPPAYAQFAAPGEQSMRNGSVVAPKIQGFNNATSGSQIIITQGPVAKNEFTDLDTLESAYGSVIIGRQAGVKLNNEPDSVIIGNQAGAKLTSQGFYETGAFSAVGNGFHDVIIGPYAMGNADNSACTGGLGNGSFSTAIGAYSLYNMGCSSLTSANTAIGDHSGADVTSGGRNTIIGNDTGGPTTGSNNTILGQNAGGFQLTSATNDTLLGSGVGNTTLITGTNDILIGTHTGVDTPASSTSNFLNIGNLIFGTSLGTSGTGIAGLVGVGTATPSATLDVNGGALCEETALGTQSAAGTITPNFQTQCAINFTFGAGNLTIANPSNPAAGKNFQITANQDGTGSRTITWGANYKCAGATCNTTGLTLSTAASAKDVISCHEDTAATINCVLAGKAFQ